MRNCCYKKSTPPYCRDHMIEAMAGLRITTIFTFMSLIITLQTSSAQRFDIKVTETPVIAPVGSDAALGCSLVPAGSAESMTIKFHRGDPSSYVYVYNKNPEDPGNQDVKYQDRTEFLTENIRGGYVTLTIRNVQPSDTGNYICLFEAPNHYSTGIVELQLAAIGKEPTIQQGKNGKVTGPCESSGWYPEPKLQWIDSEGHILESEVSITYIDETTLYRVSSPVPQYAHSRVTCLITNELLNVKQQKSVDLPSSRKTTAIAVVGTTAAAAVAAAVASLGCYIYKNIKGKADRELQRNELKEKEDHSKPLRKRKSSSDSRKSSSDSRKSSSDSKISSI
uniref:Butyrophilin-like 2 n=1 Tax=Xenopus tropicalis TaxID=8364 RepID=A0A803K6C1_XENTR